MKTRALSSFLRTLDLFGKPITLTVNGQLAFKTLFGGIVSILLLAALFTYGSLKLVKQVNLNIEEQYVTVYDTRKEIFSHDEYF